ncbi:MAG: aminotransferase class V-fold PLP-dependent enzyme, partial [Candidatus Aureabacteria bacterium]|nr:aminotransferase class V-fold PLP-dependent enzyme [Candidatus Auribacterota bacterium]
KKLGGLKEMQNKNEKKAALLYDSIDQSGGYYKGTCDINSRSLMNITFRLPSEELETAFADESKKQGFIGLKGHRSVGGMRASLYNAFPIEGVEALVQFMKDFKTRHG